jgi:flagellar motility protein MotE (MotC chaperone)
MKKLIAVGVIGLLLFCGSAAVSWYLGETATPEHAAKGRAAPSPSGAARGSDTRSKTAAVPPVENVDERSAVRPPYTVGADEAVRLASSLRERLGIVKDRETQLESRRKQLELVYEDIRGERGAVDALRKQLNDEVKAIEQRMSAVERVQADSVHKVSELQKNLVELEGAEQTNIKKMADMYDSMDPEAAAKILEQLANTAKMDTAVKLLAQMKERQAAKVLAALPADSGLAAQLLEKLKGYKRSTASAQK